MEVGMNVRKEQFMQAYAFGEKALAIHPLIKPHYTFDEVLRIKLQQQFDFLTIVAADKLEKIVTHCMTLVAASIGEARKTLAALAAQYPLVLVSNFYGNIAAVLTDFQINSYFNAIVESAVVGVRKPNPEIYKLGVKAIGLQAEECVVVGDSFKKDILPGKEAGCQTIWLNVDGFAEDLENVNNAIADRQITDFAQVPSCIIEWNERYGIST